MQNSKPILLLFVTPWTVAHQAPLSMRFSRQEYWSGLPCPPPGDLSDSVIEPRFPTLQADTLPSDPPGKPSGPSILTKGLWTWVFLAVNALTLLKSLSPQEPTSLREPSFIFTCRDPRLGHVHKHEKYWWTGY